MSRYKIYIEYDGTDFNGWQIQPAGKTIEGELEAALQQILREPVDVVGQGRTDSGVHAEGQTGHFDFPGDIDKHKLQFALLGVLPRSIAVWNVQEVDDEFHARFDARARRYRYQIITRPSPLWEKFADLVLEDLDMEVMRHCARHIVGKHDFESFTRSGEDQPDAFCEVFESEFSRSGHVVMYHIKANRFVRHMVRRLVGTMIQVGKGKRSAGEFVDLLEHPRKDMGGYGAAARGLILEKVEY